MAVGRIRRSGPVEQFPADVRGAGDFEPGQYAGRNFHFGIREHAMGAVCNGLALCGLRAFGATFFIFSVTCGRRSGWPR